MTWRSSTSLMDAMAVDLPEGEADGLRIQRFEIGPNDPGNLRERIRGSGRQTREGTYTRLILNGQLWMSDTDAERRDHMLVLREAERVEARRVLINGLGLGMVIKGLLSFEHVEHVDVVERDQRVADLVGPHYTQTGRVAVHIGDAYEQCRRWPRGTRWDVGWSDIWADVSTDDLPDMARLNRSYGRRCGWHACWGQELIIRESRRRGWL